MRGVLRGGRSPLGPKSYRQEGLAAHIVGSGAPGAVLVELAIAELDRTADDFFELASL